MDHLLDVLLLTHDPNSKEPQTAINVLSKTTHNPSSLFGHFLSAAAFFLSINGAFNSPFPFLGSDELLFPVSISFFAAISPV